MADRGFTIQESVALHQAQLAIPAFTRGRNQLDPLDGKRTRGIANVRIHVERVIGLLRQSILSCREYYQWIIWHVQRKVEKFHLLTGWSGFVQPLQIFPHLLFPLSKPISFYKTFISLQTWVRQNWYLILRPSYVWYCTVMASPCNNTSQKHSNVEWSETIQNLAMSFITFFSWVSAFFIFVINIQSLGLGLELFPLYHPMVSLSLLSLCFLALIIHKLGQGNKGKGESTLVKSKLT